jgi:hypothetical protein
MWKWCVSTIVVVCAKRVAAHGFMERGQGRQEEGKEATRGKFYTRLLIYYRLGLEEENETGAKCQGIFTHSGRCMNRL